MSDRMRERIEALVGRPSEMERQILYGRCSKLRQAVIEACGTDAHLPDPPSLEEDPPLLSNQVANPQRRKPMTRARRRKRRVQPTGERQGVAVPIFTGSTVLRLHLRRDGGADK